MRGVFSGCFLWVLLIGGVSVAAPLHDAARSGDLEQVKSLVASGEDINKRDRLLGWPLHQAALNDFVEIAEVLVEAGADVNVEHKTFGTPLHAAAQRGSTKTLRFLLAQGARVDVRRSDGTTPLHAAAATGDADLVAALVSAGADVNARVTRIQDWPGDYLATHAAALSGHFDIVDLLRSFGATGVNVEPLAGRIANADAEAGRTLFHSGNTDLGCNHCHGSDAADTTKTHGPNLAGIVGRPKAGVSDHTYSAALTRLGGVWTLAELNVFIAAPLDHAPGSSMDFIGIRDAQDRANIIAYLISISQ